MADGILVMSPEEARSKAIEMKNIATQLDELFNNVYTKIKEIDNVETGTYQGNNKPAQLRAQLEDFRKDFVLAYEQVIAFSDGIMTTANVSEQQ